MDNNFIELAPDNTGINYQTTPAEINSALSTNRI